MNVIPVSYTHLDVYKRQADDDDVGAAFGERHRHLQAKAAAAARDERDLAGEIEKLVHGAASQPRRAFAERALIH